MNTESIDTLNNLKERLITLRQEKMRLLELLDDLEAYGEAEADNLEKEIAALQSVLDSAKKSRKQETVFRF